MKYLILLPQDIDMVLKSIKANFPKYQINVHRQWIWGPIKEIIVKSAEEISVLGIVPEHLAWPQPLQEILETEGLEYLTDRNLTIAQLLGGTETVIDVKSDTLPPEYLLGLADKINGILVKI
jgi:hypothetical protein